MPHRLAQNAQNAPQRSQLPFPSQSILFDLPGSVLVHSDYWILESLAMQTKLRIPPPDPRQAVPNFRHRNPKNHRGEKVGP